MKRQTVLLSGIFLVAMFSGACVAKNVVVKVKPSERTNIKKEGVFYALPRTVIKVEVPVIKTKETPGKFEKFAKCFFPEDEEAKKIIHEKKTTYDLDDPVIGSRSEPDPEEVYMVKIKGNYLEDKAITMEWTENGVMTKGSTETTNRTIDIATQTAKTVVSLVSKAGVLGIAGAGIDQDLLKAITDCRDHVIQEAIKNLGPQKAVETRKELEMIFDDASNTYQKILSLQALRENLLNPVSSQTGAMPADTLQLMLKELDDLIKHYKEMFLGTAKKESWTARFAVTPLNKTWAGTGKYFELFEFSETGGMCPITVNPASEVRFMDSRIKEGFSNCGGTTTTRELVQLNLTLEGGQIKDTIATAFDAKSEDGERGFYYRIPVMTTGAIIRSSKEKGPTEIFRTQLAVAQLGLTASLPASTGGRKTKYEVELYETGALKNFKLGSEALIQDTTVKGFGEAAETALDKRAEVKKAAAAANEPLAQVKSVSDLLAECKKIKDAQEALGQPVSLPKQCIP